MIPSDECHIAEKYDSDSKWSLLRIQITVELLGSQNSPSSWAVSHMLGCEPAQRGGVCAVEWGRHAQADVWLPLEGKHRLSESENPRGLGKWISELETKTNYILWSNEFQIWLYIRIMRNICENVNSQVPSWTYWSRIALISLLSHQRGRRGEESEKFTPQIILMIGSGKLPLENR